MHENRTTPIPIEKTARSAKSPPSHTPAPAPSVGELPTSLTFFLSVNERRLVLKKLKRFKGDRRTALLRALRIDPIDGTTRQEARRG